LIPRELAFAGDFSARLPDLVMVPRRDEYVYNERPSYGEVIVDADSTTGTHSRDGIIIGWGRGINRGARFANQPDLRDVGPTALYSLGCSLTRDMDGRLLAELYAEGCVPVYKGSSYREPRKDNSSHDPVYSEKEEADLKERLRALGYIE
jgi:hypothetical protein